MVVGVQAVVRRRVGRGGAAGRRPLGLGMPLLGLGWLRRRVAGGVDEALPAGVPSGGEVRLVRGAGRLGGEGAGVLGRGRRRLLGAFTRRAEFRKNFLLASNQREK